MADQRGLPAAPFGIKSASKFVPTQPPDDEFFKNITSEGLQHQIPKYLFIGSQFAQWLAFNQHRSDYLRALRCVVQIDTIHCLLRGKYFLEDKSVLLKKPVMEKCSRSTRMYRSDFKFPDFKASFNTTTINVVEGDCLEVALKLKQASYNPVCLIMASSSNPGGGYRRGAGGQEENLHRRTNLLQCMDDPYLMNPTKKWSYPLDEFGGMYVGESIVFRESEQKGYGYLEEPKLMSFVAVSCMSPLLPTNHVRASCFIQLPREAQPSNVSTDCHLSDSTRIAYSNPPLEVTAEGETIIANNIAKRVFKKIQTILSIAAHNGNDSIVLSAFGCGAYGNPPKHMARICKEVINTHFKNVFCHIVFAIFDDHNSFKLDTQGNVISFGSVFKVEIADLDTLHFEK